MSNKSVKDMYDVKLVERNDIKDFIETYHYSKSINGVISDYCFALIEKDTGRLCGAMIYGRMAMANQWRKYGSSPEEVQELRRLATLDETPTNTESFFIAKTLRWLRKNVKELKTVVSYADPYYNHEGVIYQASNFEYVGKTAKGRFIKLGDKLYHDKAIRSYYKGKLKPYAQRLRDKLESGEAYYVNTPGKNIYIYRLRK